MTLNELIKKYKPHELDFVYPKKNDTRVYLDLYLIYNSPDERWHKVHALIFEYFNYHLNFYRKKKISEEDLVEKLVFPEVPYIALGHCKDGIYGSGTGGERADVIKDSIFDDDEVQKIGIEALASTSITIGGWGPDLLSDMIANFGIHHLLEYTSEQVALYELETAEFQIRRSLKLPEFEWVPLSKVRLPIFKNGEPRIFVPKHLVRTLPIFTTRGYYDNYLKYLLQEEKGDRVRSIRTIAKPPKVSFDEIEAELKKRYETIGEATKTIGLQRPGTVKSYIVDPFVYKKHHTKKKKEKINWEEYKVELGNIQPGTENARLYADTIRKILMAVYSGSLVNGTLERHSVDNIYRYDITFANASETPFFTFLKNQQIKAGVIVVEAKNYKETIVSNKELNQANGYGISGGREFVIVVSRDKITDAQIKKCGRHFLSHKILILPISDEDVFDLLKNRETDRDRFDSFLIDRVKQIMEA